MSSQSQGTVLVVDRCQADRDLSRRTLVDAGYQVSLARSGADGVQLAQVKCFDLIVLGVADDDAALDTVRSLRDGTASNATPILIAGADLSSDTITAILDGGADEYIAKPFSRKEFLLRVRFALGVRRVQRTARNSQDRLTREVSDMKELHGFFEEILAQDTVQTTCEHSVETARKMTASDRVSLLLVEPEKSSMRFAHAVGIDHFAWQDATVPLSSPVAGRAVATQREVVINESAPWRTAGDYQSRGFISMPLICRNGPARGSVLGVLNVTERRDRGPYQQQDVLALRQLARAAAFAIDAVRTRRNLDVTRDSIIFSLARLSEYRHASTGKHLERVQALSLLLARRLVDDPRVGQVIDAQFLADLGRASPLHDVGKVGIPDRILLKEGKLTPEEYEIIKDHTRIGATTLQSVMAAGQDASFLKMAMDIAHCHHERYDGTGYPRGLAGQQIPLSARIVCLADSYDAIRMPREYKPARSHTDAVGEMVAGAGTQYDPAVVDAFCALQDQFERVYSTMVERRRPTQEAAPPLELSASPLPR